jgi:hypothetical protein
MKKILKIIKLIYEIVQDGNVSLDEIIEFIEQLKHLNDER